MPYRIILTFVLVLFFQFGINPAVHAETFDLDQAVNYALTHNPDLLAARERVTAAQARGQVASGARLPSLGASYSARSSNNPLDVFADKLNTRQVTTPDFDPARLNHPGSSDLYAAQLAVRLPLYSGGRLSANKLNAEEMEKTAQLQYQRAREITAFQARRAYLNVQTAQQALAIAEDAVKAAQDHARTTGQLAREGRTVTSDKLTAEVNLAAVQASREQAQTRLEAARDQLKLVLGVPLDSDLTLVTVAMAQDAVSANLAESEQRELTQRKDLAAARAMNQAAKARIQDALAAHKPNVDVIATRNWFNDSPALDNSSSSVMGVLSLDLYAGGRHQGEIGAAAAEERESQWQVQALEQNVRREVREAYENLREARARHERANDNVERARENVRLVKQRYGQGRTILIDLLQAERAYTEARMEASTSSLNLAVGQAALPLAEGALALPSESTP